MIIDSKYQKEMVHILTDIFPGVLIYYFGGRTHSESADSKLHELDIALDLGRRIGTLILPKRNAHSAKPIFHIRFIYMI